MTILQSLNGYYDRMAARGEASQTGFSREKISFAIVLSAGGVPVDITDLRARSGNTLQPVLRTVPSPPKRTMAILPNRLWDKSSYALGRTAGAGKRTVDEHAAFKKTQRDLVGGSNDAGLVALLLFLDRWQPEAFDAAPFRADMLDANVVFQLDGDIGLIHDRPAAKALIGVRPPAEEDGVVCLVTGVPGPIQRLHPNIKGVQGAQSSGAALVSFNLDAFTSYGKAQGSNAPTSEAAAFRYGEALNRMLARGSDNRLTRPIGDATVAFWADTSGVVGEEAAKAAESLFFAAIEPDPATDDDAQAAAQVEDSLKAVAEGRPQEADPILRPGTRFHVLGLAPNAARLSVRFWLDDTLEGFARRLLDHRDDLRIEPRPRRWGEKAPSVGRLLVQTTAMQEKFDNIPPLLAGEVMRAVLSGASYPRTLLATALMRLRAGDDRGSGWHAAVVKACLNRPCRLEAERLARDHPDPARLAVLKKEMLPVALDPTRTDDVPYNLGRLFAVLEAAQYAALGRVNASIADRYYGAASSTPARVFGPLLRGLRTHIADARKRGRGGWIEPRVAEIIATLPPGLKPTLKLEEQGRFAVGYYHEKARRWDRQDAGKSDDGETGDE